MTLYLLDTNIVSYLADPTSPFHPRVATMIAALPEQAVLAVSLLTFYELAYGYVRHPGHSRLLTVVRDADIRVLAPSEAGAMTFARLKDAWRRHTGAREKALVRHNVDLILAGTAIEAGAVLVSNDAIFAALAGLEPRLSVENLGGLRCGYGRRGG